MKPHYAGIIQAPDFWWLSLSKSVYDSWEMPDGPVRTAILDAAQMSGVLHNLGPSTMTSREVYHAALDILGLGRYKDTAAGQFNPLDHLGEQEEQ